MSKEIKVGDVVMAKSWSQLTMKWSASLKTVRSTSHIAPNGDKTESLWVYCDDGSAYCSTCCDVMETVNV